MAQDIALAGATYPSVPAVNLPKSGGGTVTFTDVSDTTAAASDVASGKYFYTASGIYTAGTASGGSSFPLLATSNLGTLSTTSTSATNTNKTMTVTGYNDYDMLIVVVSTDTHTNSRHLATQSFVILTGTSNINTKNTYSVAGNKWNAKLGSSGTVSTRQSTTAYGIYVYSASVSSSTMTLSFYYRYNNNNTGTINGNYTARVYGVKLYSLIV